MKRKVIVRWLKVLIIVYCLIGIIVYSIQDRLIFLPVKVAREQKYNFPYPYTEVNIPYNKETNINIIQFKTRDTTPKGVVLYFHGNKMNVSWYSRFAPYFTRSNYEVWMIDYPGYGKSTGKFSEPLVYDWSLIMY